MMEIIHERDNSIMVLIPAGNFIMGTNKGQPWEGPEHVEYLDEYYIDKYLVTNEMYRRFVKETGYRAEGEWERFCTEDRLRHPVIMVSWNDAMAYAEWAGKTLPTEAQWEKAARGTEGYVFPWGNRWDAKKCNCWPNNAAKYSPNAIPRLIPEKYPATSEVGAYPQDKSPFGCYDMSGNMSEWTLNGYYPYPNCNFDYTENFKDLKVLRGGSWLEDHIYFFKCYTRFGCNPSTTKIDFGFRCAKNVR